MSTHTAGSISRYLADLQKSATLAERERTRAALWQRTYAFLCKVAKQWLNNSEDAEEVVDDALLAFLRSAEAGKLKKLDNRKDFWSLVRLIVRRLSLNKIRARSVRPSDGAEALQESITPGFGPADAAFSDAESPDDVWDFLAFLDDLADDPLLRDIAFVHYYEGQSKDEICRELNIAPRTFYRKLELIQATVELFEQNLRDAVGGE
jgi:RNA polymerase sigma factor (sigma-70 family)